MQARTKLLILAAPLAAGAALIGIASAVRPTPPPAQRPLADDSEEPQRDIYLDRLFGLATPAQS